MAHSPRDYQIAFRYLRSGYVDGAILVSMHGKRPLDLHSLGVPEVLAGRSFGNDVLSIWTPTTSAGHAWPCGICSPAAAARWPAGPTCPRVKRLHGYRVTIAEAGLSDSGLIVFGDFGRVSAEHAVYRLLDRRPGLDAVFVASDLMAAGALRALRPGGRRVPDHVAVIGFEDSPLARYTDPKLTTVRQLVEAMGERLASELVAVIGRAGQDPVHVVLDTELVIRESA